MRPNNTCVTHTTQHKHGQKTIHCCCPDIRGSNTTCVVSNSAIIFLLISVQSAFSCVCVRCMLTLHQQSTKTDARTFGWPCRPSTKVQRCQCFLRNFAHIKWLSLHHILTNIPAEIVCQKQCSRVHLAPPPAQALSNDCYCCMPSC